MSPNLNTLIPLLLITFSTVAHAGGDVSAGGGAFICPDKSQSEFLDLFEAQIPGLLTDSGLTIPSSDAPVDDQIKAAFDKLIPGSALYQVVMATYDKVKAAPVKVLPPHTGIAWPSDAHNEYQEEGCAPLGIIKFHDAYTDESGVQHKDWIAEDRTNLLAMPNQQQAAAMVHETIYKFLRENYGDSDSVRARAIVGHLFANETQPELTAALLKIARLNVGAKSAELECSTDNTGNLACKYPLEFSGQTVIGFKVSFEMDTAKSDPECRPPSANKDDEQRNSFDLRYRFGTDYKLNPDKDFYRNYAVSLMRDQAGCSDSSLKYITDPTDRINFEDCQKDINAKFESFSNNELSRFIRDNVAFIAGFPSRVDTNLAMLPAFGQTLIPVHHSDVLGLGNYATYQNATEIFQSLRPYIDSVEILIPSLSGQFKVEQHFWSNKYVPIQCVGKVNISDSVGREFSMPVDGGDSKTIKVELFPAI